MTGTTPPPPAPDTAEAPGAAADIGLRAPAPATGLIEGFVCDGRGAARGLTPGELMADPLITPPQGGYVWLHFSLSESRGWVAQNLGLPKNTLRALFADETRPRFTQYDDRLLMNLRGVNLTEGESLEDMVSLRVHLTKDRLVTVRHQKSFAVEAVRDDLRKGRAPKSPGVLLLRMISGLTDRIEPVVDELADRVDAFEELSLERDSDDLRGQLSSMRHDAIVFRRYVAPQRDAVGRFATHESELLPQTARNAAREESDRITRVVEELDIVRERAAVINEQLAAKRADEMNRNMMIISVVSAVFLPLGFLTGLLGINVGGMPGADNDASFWIVCGLCVVLGGALVTVFQRLGWI